MSVCVSVFRLLSPAGCLFVISENDMNAGGAGAYWYANLLLAYAQIPIHRRRGNCNALQRTATHCNTLQWTATHCNIAHLLSAYAQIPIHWRRGNCNACNTLQHTAIDCNALQQTAMHCNRLQHMT